MESEEGGGVKNSVLGLIRVHSAARSCGTAFRLCKGQESSGSSPGTCEVHTLRIKRTHCAGVGRGGCGAHKPPTASAEGKGTPGHSSRVCSCAPSIYLAKSLLRDTSIFTAGSTRIMS